MSDTPEPARADAEPPATPPTPIASPSPLRRKLAAAAFLLLGVPALASADPMPSSPSWQLDATGLLYGERQRTSVIEPTARLTRLFANGQALSGQITLDAITGASPTGAVPSGQPLTTTTASGMVTTLPAGQVPTKKFNDLRGASDLSWDLPVGTLFKATTGAHYSREKDYQSVGASESFSLDVLRRLATITIGGGVNRDGVFPRGGTPVPLSDGTQVLTTGTDRKDVTTGLIGLSRVLTRRWLMGLSMTRTLETGYLTEPYKVISIVDSTDTAVDQRTENRPARHDRRAALASSVYHLAKDVIYVEYRYYWDDWGIRSHTADAKYRLELPDDAYLLPHVRYYTQSAASFYRPSLPQGDPLPTFASADYRIGDLSGVTIGATYGFKVPGSRGEWNVRVEYLRQWGPAGSFAGTGTPGGDDGGGGERATRAAAVALPSSKFGAFTSLDIGTIVVGYSIPF
ncbi:MAG TPA: DUF3570 domain-containing protein [Candidatus Udaeobacter sp.]|nr:DUF3570 domain-containing protein [Candidatus Udaeobacter sp.]